MSRQCDCPCGPPGTIWRGDYCRCCGEKLGGAGCVIYCDRRLHGACPFCGRGDSCGPHGNDDRGVMPPRRFCEFDQQRCDVTGACPTHGHRQASVR
jgi:hypothetical protein